MLTLRSTLFLACLTAILHGEHYLDWMDALALQLVPAHAFERELKRDSSFRTLVLTLTPEFFEAEFGGHTPINRNRFQDLIKAVVAAYPRARVVAIDYDFSPSGGARCAAPVESSVREIAAIEAEQQERFDKFLTEDLKNELGQRQATIVLITPLPAPDECMPTKRAWQRKIAGPGVRFGDHALLYHNLFGTVVKHQEVSRPSDPCAPIYDEPPPLAAVVNAADDCISNTEVAHSSARLLAASSTTTSREATAARKVKLINFGKARRAVFLCPLWEWDDVTQNCRRRLKDVASSDPDRIEVVFIGSAYGQEDRYRTPSGDLHGVQIHAYTAYSLGDPVIERILISFVVDLVIGMLAGMIFYALWSGAAHNPDQSFCRFVCIVLVFAVLLGFAWLAIRMTPFMLNRGAWLNPLVILVGLFIHSYADAVERVAKATPPHRAAAPTNRLRDWSRDFVGFSKEGRPLVTLKGHGWM